jgi:hypothetical protein
VPWPISACFWHEFAWTLTLLYASDNHLKIMARYTEVKRAPMNFV